MQKQIFKSLFFLTIFLILPNFVWAAPSITSATINAGTLSIIGTNLGTKTTPAPVLWDNFNAETSGNIINTNGWIPDAGNSPVYSSIRAHSGSVSALTQFVGVDNYSSITRHPIGNLSTIYYSFWVYVERVGGVASRNIKLTRVSSSGGTDLIHSTPNIGATVFYDAVSPAYYIQSGTGTDVTYYDPRDINAPSDVGRWAKMEFYIKLSSTPGAADGEIQTFMDGYQIRNSVGDVTLGISPNGTTFQNLTLSFYVAHDVGGDYYIYNDDIYLDNTRARVELCPNVAWATRGQCETQIPSAWNAGQITANFNDGALLGGVNAYVYVVDENGNVNADGYAITLPGVLDATPPSAPTGLGVI
ncbi:MAG: hypothetical protein HGA36_03800 [Candidatus Moranbacteria bacterium]|nr:hypothetical protein [Candidatus Moranbacteria bacterium]